MAGGVSGGDLELLRIEMETIWGVDTRGRIGGPDVVVGCAAAGLTLGIGVAVPESVAGALADAVARASGTGALDAPPAVLDECRRLLERALPGPLELTPGSGPSYLVHDTVAFASDSRLVRSDGEEARALLGANPGNWQAEEWKQLIEGRLGPWVMATQRGAVISICHSPAISARGAEAGTWTQPEFRGRGLAAAVTAAWATLLRPSGRHLFYSTSRTNVSSQQVAARLGLRPLGWLWQLASPRRVRITP